MYKITYVLHFNTLYIHKHVRVLILIFPFSALFNLHVLSFSIFTQSMCSNIPFPIQTISVSHPRR